jgi:ABC-type arginine transport system ATPase subunit
MIYLFSKKVAAMSLDYLIRLLEDSLHRQTDSLLSVYLTLEMLGSSSNIHQEDFDFLKKQLDKVVDELRRSKSLTNQARSILEPKVFLHASEDLIA